MDLILPSSRLFEQASARERIQENEVRIETASSTAEKSEFTSRLRSLEAEIRPLMVKLHGGSVPAEDAWELR